MDLGKTFHDLATVDWSSKNTDSDMFEGSVWFPSTLVAEIAVALVRETAKYGRYMRRFENLEIALDEYSIDPADYDAVMERLKKPVLITEEEKKARLEGDWSSIVRKE